MESAKALVVNTSTLEQDSLTGVVRASMHIHSFIGVEVVVDLIPPFVHIEPMATMSLPPEDGPMSEHEHELIEIPSLEAVEEQIPQPHRFSAHFHTYEAEGVGVSGAGVTTGTLNPPPL